MANTNALPVRIGLLYDFPQMGDLFAKALRLGIDEVAATGRLDRDVELVERQSRGLPSGSEAEVVRAFDELDDEDVVAIVGPVDLRQRTDRRRRCATRRASPRSTTRAASAPARSGCSTTRSVRSRRSRRCSRRAWSTRGLRRAAVIFDQSPVGRRYAECFEAARARLGLEVTGTASISALAEDATELLERLREGRARRARVSRPGRLVARGGAGPLDALGWDVPVLANSALMFGYARPDWRDGYAGWEYIDTIADDNRSRARLARESSRTRRADRSAARRTTSAGSSARASPPPST